MAELDAHIVGLKDGSKDNTVNSDTKELHLQSSKSHERNGVVFAEEGSYSSNEKSNADTSSLITGNVSELPCLIMEPIDEPKKIAPAAGGEGSCGGTCAMIPLDKRPMISKAYETSDFSYVDPEPVVLPMLDDDGRLMLPR